MIKGFAFQLREVELSDAPFILKLRNDKALNRFINDTSSNLADQVEWISQYQQRDYDFYFVVESINPTKPAGVISFYDIDKQKNSAEWGRWIVCQDSLCAVESVYLLFKFAFDVMGLRTLFSRTVSANTHVVNFHNSYGAQWSKLISNHCYIGGEMYDVVEHQVSFENWQKNISIKLEKAALKIANRI